MPDRQQGSGFGAVRGRHPETTDRYSQVIVLLQIGLHVTGKCAGREQDLTAS